jgi:hypothetical protein
MDRFRAHAAHFPESPGPIFESRGQKLRIRGSILSVSLAPRRPRLPHRDRISPSPRRPIHQNKPLSIGSPWFACSRQWRAPQDSNLRPLDSKSSALVVPPPFRARHCVPARVLLSPKRRARRRARSVLGRSDVRRRFVAATQLRPARGACARPASRRRGGGLRRQSRLRQCHRAITRCLPSARNARPRRLGSRNRASWDKSGDRSC